MLVFRAGASCLTNVSRISVRRPDPAAGAAHGVHRPSEHHPDRHNGQVSSPATGLEDSSDGNQDDVGEDETGAEPTGCFHETLFVVDDSTWPSEGVFASTARGGRSLSGATRIPADGPAAEASTPGARRFVTGRSRRLPDCRRGAADRPRRPWRSSPDPARPLRAVPNSFCVASTRIFARGLTTFREGPSRVAPTAPNGIHDRASVLRRMTIASRETFQSRAVLRAWYWRRQRPRISVVIFEAHIFI